MRQNMFRVFFLDWKSVCTEDEKHRLSKPALYVQESVAACTPDMSAVIALAPAVDNRCRMIALRAVILTRGFEFHNSCLFVFLDFFHYGFGLLFQNIVRPVNKTRQEMKYMDQKGRHPAVHEIRKTRKNMNVSEECGLAAKHGIQAVLHLQILHSVHLRQ